MKPPAASPGRAEKPQLPAPAPPGLARLLLSKSRRGGRSRRAPATSPMFVSARGGGGRSRASSGGAEGEPSSPKVTCIGQVRMRNKGKKKKKKKPNGEKAKGYCRCLKKAFLCGGLFEFDRRRRSDKQAAPPPPPEVEQRSSRRSPWVFSSRDVAVAAAPTTKPADARSGKAAEEEEDDADDDLIMEVGAGGFGSVGGREEINGGGGEKGEKEEEPELVSSATTTPPKNALLLMRCRSAPQNRTSPLMARFLVPGAAEPSPSTPTRDRDDAPAPAEFMSPSPRKQASPAPSPSPRKAFSPVPSPSSRRNSEKLLLLGEDDCDEKQAEFAAVQDNRAQEEVTQDEYEEEDEEMRCSSARPLVLQRCKSEPATTAAAKMAAGPAADATTAGCFWAHGGSSGRRRHAPALALTGH